MGERSVCRCCGTDQNYNRKVQEFICNSCARQNFLDVETGEYYDVGPSMAYFWPQAYTEAYDSGHARATRDIVRRWLGMPLFIRIGAAIHKKWGWWMMERWV